MEGICDLIRTQWMAYQAEDIPEHTYIAPENPTSSGRVQQSYWDYALKYVIWNHLQVVTRLMFGLTTTGQKFEILLTIGDA